ncbi:pyroglutamyl-peptidase I [Apilactobacillus bombintestini]|uniref:Pyrrolidone-carboxylate peptidase n=1 Tax=Apilactobacillus bombintestini TaxID=2419772 RepID=A0A387AQY0_9LACO|nr:pyroglutamyl-peptidase I [Apilactobacillus bombintestini]AYF92038.1 pyroglutamyl-peptidase I [Apilactobacillus bombintestini]
MKILVTGFNPFNGSNTNASMKVLESLPDKIDNVSIIKQLLPTEFKNSSAILKETVDKFTPDVIVCLGEAAGRDSITPETIAFNEDNTVVADNAGYKPSHEPIQANGDEHYHVNIPVEEIVKALVNAGIPSKLSNNAGRYVCNHIMYECQYLIHSQYPNMKATFIHLPANHPYKKDMPTLDLATEVQGIKIALSTIEKTL